MTTIIEIEGRLLVAKEWWGREWLEQGRGGVFMVRTVLHPEVYTLWDDTLPGFIL